MWWTSVATPGDPEMRALPRCGSGRLCLFVLAGCCWNTTTLAAEPAADPPTYRWTDSRGIAHVSNLPPQAYGRDGHLKPAYHPNRAEAQHPAMVQALRAREAELTAARLAAESAMAGASVESNADVEPGNAAFSRVIPKRRMSFGELLQMEKNAGRPLE